MKQITFSKFALIVCLLCAGMILITAKSFAQDSTKQDTIYTKKVLLANVELSRKTGRVIRTWYHKKTVKLGYIIKRADGLFVVNGKVMIPNNFSYVPYPPIVADESINNPKKQ